jgi:hypothetical protein
MTVVVGVDLDKVNELVFSRYCAKYGLIRTNSLTNDIALFSAKIMQVVDRKKVVCCDTCGGTSSIEDPECPYCGTCDGEMPVIENNLTKPPEPIIVTSKTKAIAKPQPTKGNAQDAKEALLRTLEPTLEAMGIEPEISTDLAVHQSQDIEVANISDAIEAVKQAKELTVVCHWQLGQTILKCFKNDLWKQLKDEEGGVRYTNFYRFCENELGLSGRYCHSLMDIASSFSADDVAKIGVAKLGIILRLPEQDRDKLLIETRQGIPYSELSVKVRELNSESPPPWSRKGIPIISPSESDPDKPIRSNIIVAPPSVIERVITTTHAETRIHIPLYCNGGANDFIDEGNTPLRRATRLADDPVGEEYSINGVCIKYMLICNQKNELELVVERRKSMDK